MKPEIIYDDPYVCIQCGEEGGRNTIIEKDSIANTMCECETTCKKCGFKGYWAYGFHERQGVETESSFKNET